MEFPIVNIFTEDKVQLYGLYIKPQTSNSIFINIHGTASNFYEEDFIKYLTEDFMENNISMLSTNNRGTGVYDCYAKTGSAVEKFEDCIKDIDAWIEFAIKQKYKNKVNGIILLAPADSYASHRQLNGKPNNRLGAINKLISKSKQLISNNLGDVFLPRNAYGPRHGGIMPKSAESYINFLGDKSEVLKALPFATKKLDNYSKIKIPIFVAIGDGDEYTSLKTDEALDLLKTENKLTETHKLKNCNHDFEGKETELSSLINKFILSLT